MVRYYNNIKATDYNNIATLLHNNHLFNNIIYRFVVNGSCMSVWYTVTCNMYKCHIHPRLRKCTCIIFNHVLLAWCV